MIACVVEELATSVCRLNKALLKEPTFYIMMYVAWLEGWLNCGVAGVMFEVSCGCVDSLRAFLHPRNSILVIEEDSKIVFLQFR
jgi:hypothetical protein